MAADTDPTLQNQVIYSIYVRNHTEEGTFRAVIPDLPRIRALGVDIIWLMPIQPIGEKARKGTAGSPYAIRDYRAVNPELGTLDDFVALVDAIHAEGMRCIIDVVYNHTSPDSVLWQTHPEWFYKRPDGTPGNRVGDWSDVIDLDYGQPALWDYQIETLVYWAQWVDGFRCDVGSLVPVAFWERARAEVAKVRPGAIWLSESIHRSFGKLARALGMNAARDTEAYAAFDIEYQYDIWEAFERYLAGETTLDHVLDLVDFEECTYPAGYNKMRFLENHDQPRIMARDGDLRDVRNLTALTYFLKGTTLVYAGEEVGSAQNPNLFEHEPVDWDTGRDLSGLMRTLSQVKHERLGARDLMTFAPDSVHDVAVVYRDDLAGERGGARTVGVFSLRGRTVDVRLDVPDGDYENLLGGEAVSVRDGHATTQGEPILFGCPLPHLAM